MRLNLLLALCLVPVGLLTPILEIGPTHVFNPDWPGHARLHEVWQLVENSSFAIFCLWLAWGRGAIRLAASIGLVLTGSFLTSFLLAPLYAGTMRHSDGSERLVAGINSAVVIMVIVAAGLLYILWRTRGSSSAYGRRESADQG
ncbi:MAG: hypothetical protein Q7T68_17380 [Sphingopyxis sp.]|nr:hypothetical protein [Sphingopyxis sp.]